MPNRTYMRKSYLKTGFNAFSGLHGGLVLLKDLSKPSMPNRTYMRKSFLKIWVSMPFRAYTKGWCYWKTYPNLRRQIGLIWVKIILKRGFNAFSGLHEGLVLLKDLPKPSMPNRTYVMKIILKGVSMSFRAYTEGWCYWKTYPNLRCQIGLKWEKLFWKCIGNLMAPTPHGFTWRF